MLFLGRLYVQGQNGFQEDNTDGMSYTNCVRFQVLTAVTKKTVNVIDQTRLD